MTIIEAINLNRNVLNILTKEKIRLDDVKYADMYNEYLKMINSGNKVTYTVAVMAMRYNVSERKVYSIVKAFGKQCTVDAV